MIAASDDPSNANVQLVIKVTARLGMAKRVADDLPRLLGRPPTTLESFVEPHRVASGV